MNIISKNKLFNRIHNVFQMNKENHEILKLNEKCDMMKKNWMDGWMKMKEEFEKKTEVMERESGGVRKRALEEVQRQRKRHDELLKVHVEREAVLRKVCWLTSRS